MSSTLESAVAFLIGMCIVYLMFRCMRILVIVGLLALVTSSGRSAVQFINCTTNCIYVVFPNNTHEWLPLYGVNSMEVPAGTVGGSLTCWWVTSSRVFLTNVSSTLYDNTSYAFSGVSSGPVVDSTGYYPVTNGAVSSSYFVTNIDVVYQTNVDDNFNTNIYYYFSTNIVSSGSGFGAGSVTNLLSVGTDSMNTDNVFPSLLEGMGSGFMLLGFGWILGMVRKTTSDF